MENKRLQEIVKAIGAMTEIGKLYYDNFLKVGFPQQQALELTKECVATHIKVAASVNSESEF